MSKSNLTAKVLYIGAVVPGADKFLENIENIEFSTLYPGGLYDNFTCFVPCDVTSAIPIKHCQDIYIYDGLTLLWYGLITQLTLVIDAENSGIGIEAVGYLAYWNVAASQRRWIDRRFSSNVKGVWEYQPTDLSDKCTIDQSTRLKFTPKAVAWADGDYVSFRYSIEQAAPVRRIKYTYKLEEAAQAWELSLWRSTDYGANFTQITNLTGETWTTGSTSVITASGTGNIDLTFAGGVDVTDLEFRLYSRAAQTPAADGSIRAKITDLAVIGQNASGAAVTTVADIIKAIMADMSYTDTTYVTANTYDLTDIGFVADDNREYLLAVINRLMKFSSTATAYSFGYNETGQLYYEAQPALDDYDYIVSLSAVNLKRIELVQSADFGELKNNLFVSYTDEDGKLNIVTHFDDPLLDDATSEGLYFARKHLADAGTSTAAGAIAHGKQILAAKSGLQYYMRGPLNLTGEIQQKDGAWVPVSHVRAGKRIKIKNLLGSGLTFLITRTRYNDKSGSLSITAGVPDDLAVYLAQRSALLNVGV